MTPLGTRLSDWPTTDEQGRRVLLDQLLERLPPWLELAELGAQPRFRDARSGETWRFFSAGMVTLGATPERIEAVEAFQRRAPLTMFDPTVYWPVREVSVSPFLLMESVISLEGEPQVFFRDVLGEQEALLTTRGQRLPTEAEWECAWWTVQQQPEHWDPAMSELCADGWRPHLLELAAVDPLVAGGPSVVRSGTFDSKSLLSVMPQRVPLSLVRMVAIRPALDLPALY